MRFPNPTDALVAVAVTWTLRLGTRVRVSSAIPTDSLFQNCGPSEPQFWTFGNEPPLDAMVARYHEHGGIGEPKHWHISRGIQVEFLIVYIELHALPVLPVGYAVRPDRLRFVIGQEWKRDRLSLGKLQQDAIAVVADRRKAPARPLQYRRIVLQLHELPFAIRSPICRTEEHQHETLPPHQRFHGARAAVLIGQGEIGGYPTGGGPKLSSVAQALGLPPERKAGRRGDARENGKLHI